MSAEAKSLYNSLLNKLRELDLAGRFDSGEADAIRDEMDNPWLNMTPEERGEIEALAQLERLSPSLNNS